MIDLPESLRCRPNIPWHAKTVEQLEAERGYWAGRFEGAAGVASAKASLAFMRQCDAWIKIRMQEARS